jgi:hypothetical protein
MIDIDEVHKMWSEDSKIDDLVLDTESLKIPQLHSKYMTVLTEENRLLSRMMYGHQALERDKLEYYQGKMCQEDLDERGWEPLTLKILKGDIPKYIAGDMHVVSNLIRISDQREIVSLLNTIINTINNRSFMIANAIKWKQFTNGLN